ncbi:MAG TPA: ATP-binding protein [Thermoanaerobaculia bacterium]
MISFLRIISAILFVSLVLTIGVSIFLGAELNPAAPPAQNAFAAALVVFTLFTVPALAIYGWIVLGAQRAQELADEARRSLSDSEVPLETHRYRGVLGELARLLEESRQLILVQRRGLAEHDLVRARILEGIGEGVLAIDRKKNVVLANARVLEMFEVTGPAIGSPFYAVLRNAVVTAAFERALAGEAASELIACRGAAGERTVDVQILPFTGTTDIAAVALFVDVTRLTRLETIRRQFLADFSHEVRTPLAGLRSAAETLARGGLAARDEANLRGIVARQLERIERLVTDLSELNQIESGDLVLDRRPTDLRALLEGVADEFRDSAAARKVVLRVNAAPLTCAVDPVRMEQVVGNLVDNAIKFSPPGGTVHLEARRVGSGAEVTVSDEGEGIPEAERERVFNRFYRVDKSRSQSVTGTGLGLAIAKHLTMLHGGRISVDSGAARGSTFRVFLPECSGGAGAI